MERELWNAAWRGNLQRVQQLVEQGADIEASNNEGLTLLHSAVYHGRLNILQYLVEQGADIEARDNGE